MNDFNEGQKKILKYAAIAVGLMLLFPPYHASFPNGASKSYGYGFLLSPPDEHLATVDVGLLFAQWFCVAVIAGILIVMKRD